MLHFFGPLINYNLKLVYLILVVCLLVCPSSPPPGQVQRWSSSPRHRLIQVSHLAFCHVGSGLREFGIDSHLLKCQLQLATVATSQFAELSFLSGNIFFPTVIKVLKNSFTFKTYVEFNLLFFNLQLNFETDQLYVSFSSFLEILEPH